MNKKDWILAGIILVLTFLVFTPALRNDFVYWDDEKNITENQNVQELNISGLKGMFSTTITGGYTPLTSLSFALEIHFFGMKPGVFHLNNLLLHLLCTLLVYILMRRLGQHLFVAAVVAILFGIHPMRVESVAWISERKDVLYGFFFLLSLVAYISFLKNKKPAIYFLALLAFILALLSKIQAVTLPLVMLLVNYLYEKKFRFGQLLDKIPFFILSLATGLAGLYILSHEGELETSTVMPFFQRIFIGTWSLCVYIVKSLVPYPLSAIYPYPEKLSFLHYGSALVVIALAFVIYRFRNKNGYLVFGSLFFLFNVMFMLQILGAGQALMADRFTYLAYIGLFFLFAHALHFLYSGKWRIPAILIGALGLAAFGVITWQRTQVWKNTETLFSDVIRKYPKMAIPYHNLGTYYRDNNQDSKAIEYYGRSIEMNPNAYLSYNNRGEALFERGETGKALDDMNRAILLNPVYSSAWSNRGAIRGSRKEFTPALDDLNRALALDPKNLKALINRALVHYSLGDCDNTVRDATSYLKIKRDNPDMLNLRGLCTNRLNRNQESLADFTEAIRINPGSGPYYQNRSALLYKMGDTRGALQDILKARELGAKVNPDYIKMLQGG